MKESSRPQSKQVENTSLNHVGKTSVTLSVFSFFLFFVGGRRKNSLLDMLKAAFELECFINGADNEAPVRF